MEQKIEIWKPVKNFEGLYSVSSLGRVRSEERVDTIGRFKNEKILKSCKDKDGYLRLQLCKNGKRYLKAIHQLVAQAFIPNPDNLPQVNHKNEIKTDNSVYINPDGTVDYEKSNIEWITQKGNCNHATRNKRIGIKLSKQVLQFSKDGVFIKEWQSTMEIERSLGFDGGNISLCCNGKYKQSYGFIWKYKEKGAA